MLNKRLTTMNQWGDILYIGSNKKGNYRGIGDYVENLDTPELELIIKKLYLYEETFEELEEKLNAE